MSNIDNQGRRDGENKVETHSSRPKENSAKGSYGSQSDVDKARQETANKVKKTIENC
jgi:uncharacterized protein (DUF302 family)